MTERKYLSGRGGKRLLDMEKIYKQIDSGRSIDEVAKEWGVSRTTLYRRHREYQTEVAALKHKSYWTISAVLGIGGETQR